MAFQQDITCLQSPDVSNYAETARVTSIEFTANNFILTHTKEGAGWPNTHVPGWGDGGADTGDIEWTLWVVLPVSLNRWIATGCVEFWEGKKTGVGGPFSDAARNWYYYVPEMVSAPQGPGTVVGFFAVQGDERRKNFMTVQERSNVVFVQVPNGPFKYTFDEPVVPVPVPDVPSPAPQPDPIPVPVPPPVVPAADYTMRFDNIDTAIKALPTRTEVQTAVKQLLALFGAHASAGSNVTVPTTPNSAATTAAAITSIVSLFGKKK